MNNKKSINFNDEYYERIFIDNPDLSVENVVKSVTPWTEAIKKAFVGMILRNVRLEFLLLDEILPSIGLILVVMGMSSLKKENKWFNACYVLSLIETVFHLVSLGVKSTIYNNTITNSAPWVFVMLLGVAVSFASLFCLWKAICQVQVKAGLQPHCKSLIVLMCWSAVIVVLSFYKTVSWLTGVVLLVSYIAIIICLIKTTKEIGMAGYVITPAPINRMNTVLPVLLSCFMIATPMITYTLYGQYDMNWIEVTETSSSNEVTDTKNKLIGLGFPQDVLNDLSDDDILTCKDAVYVSTEAREISYGGIFDSNDAKLILSNVAIKLSDGNWEIFHHFRWNGNRNFYGTELMSLWPAYYKDYSARNSKFRGALFCDINEKSYEADYVTLTEETYVSNSIFFGKQEETKIFGEFSLPRNGKNCRGYIAYGIDVYNTGRNFNIVTEYSFPNYPSFPVLTAMEYEKSGAWESNPPFNLWQEQLIVHWEEIQG